MLGLIPKALATIKDRIRMNKIDAFENEQGRVRQLDFEGHTIGSDVMYRQFQRRNSFGLAPQKAIYRIVQRAFYEQDRADNYLTLPRATASVWKDPLENPLEDVEGYDSVTGLPIRLGSLVSSFYGLCWTERHEATQADWDSFSRGEEAVRISTSVEKLLNQVMRVTDPSYMHRAWLIGVEYKDKSLIEAMKKPDEVYKRMDSTGAQLALSAAVISKSYAYEDEVRLLLDCSLGVPYPGLVTDTERDLIRIPFNWADVIDEVVFGP